MIECVFLGDGTTEVGGRKFDMIGQRASFSEQQFVDVVRGGGVFLTRQQFQKVGITAQEVAAYGPAASRHLAPESFRAKVSSAQQVFRNLQGKVRAEGVKVVFNEF